MNACVDCLVSLNRVDKLAFEVESKTIAMAEALGSVTDNSEPRGNVPLLVSARF